MTAMPKLDWANDPVETLRAGYADQRLSMVDEVAADVTITAYDFPSGPGLCFLPVLPTGPDMLYFHGGGWIVGSPWTHQTLCSWLACFSGSPVYSAPYALAPEASWPSQPNQAVELLDWFAGARDTVFIAGDSAGAAMALWAEQGASMGARQRVQKIATFYPAFGLRSSASIDEYGAGSDGLSAAALDVMYGYLGCPSAQDFQSRFAPSGAELLMVQAECDPLADDVDWAQGFFDRKTSVIRAADQAHAFLQFAGSDPNARAIMAQIGTWFKGS